MDSQNWGDINDEAKMNALMNESDILLNLDDFFQEEMVEEDVPEHGEVVDVEPAEAVAEMEISGEGSQQFEENAVDEERAGGQRGDDVNQEDIFVIHMYHVSTSDSEDSDYESDSGSDDTSDSDSEYGFRTHELNAEGVCGRCHLEMPQNQLCN